MAVQALARTSDYLDLKRYPIDRDGEERRKIVEACQETMREAGIFVLPNFVTDAAIAQVAAETLEARPRSTIQCRYRTSYQSRGGLADFPSIHPRNIVHLDRYRLTRQSQMPASSKILEIYKDDHLLKLVEDILQRPMQRVELGDSSRAETTTVAYEGVTINTHEHSDSLFWHFDNNDFVTTLGIEQPAEGGEFQYVPFIRSEDDEKYEDVMSVYLGQHPGVRSLMLNPGTLVGFAGRRSIHRVAPIWGKARRTTAVLLFNDAQQEAKRAQTGKWRI